MKLTSEQAVKPGFTDFIQLVKAKIDDRVWNAGNEYCDKKYFKLESCGGKQIWVWKSWMKRWLKLNWNRHLNLSEPALITVIDEIISMVNKEVAQWDMTNEGQELLWQLIFILMKQFNISDVKAFLEQIVWKCADDLLSPGRGQ